jgi:hypothetical protein
MMGGGGGGMGGMMNTMSMFMMPFIMMMEMMGMGGKKKGEGETPLPGAAPSSTDPAMGGATGVGGLGGGGDATSQILAELIKDLMANSGGGGGGGGSGSTPGAGTGVSPIAP